MFLGVLRNLCCAAKPFHKLPASAVLMYVVLLVQIPRPCMCLHVQHPFSCCSKYMRTGSRVLFPDVLMVIGKAAEKMRHLQPTTIA